jgi:two-component system CheB/CheR fusion protein
MAKSGSKTSLDHDNKEELLIVGLGASAGGLKVLEKFFDSVPKDPKMAFVVIIHLSPDHKSSMAEILQEKTPLTVIQVNKRTKIEADHVYVISPGKNLTIEDDHLIVSSSPKGKQKLKTIDLFFRSLGKAKGSSAACVILSGSGSDGSLGLKTIKENGGIVLAQSPDEAEYKNMPSSAIETGLVDLILPVSEIPSKLVNYRNGIEKIKIEVSPDELPKNEAKAFEEIITQININTGHDFSQYKQKSVLRRLERRMRVNRVQKLTDYFKLIKNNPAEIENLFKDLLISVTHFFRDPDAFEEFEEKVLPDLFKNKNSEDNLRIWVPGCATGEEAYSIAILLLEYAQKLKSSPKIQLFATDIDLHALKIAREGAYSDSIEGDIKPEILSKYFTNDGFSYHVKNQVKDHVLFASHDLMKDPPFSKLDLISCRNLLIYLNRDLQVKIFNVFHYALKPEKWLFVGMSDSILEATETFNPVSKKFKIYRQNPLPKDHSILKQLPYLTKQPELFPLDNERWKTNKKYDIENLHHKLLIGQYAPASAIINKNHDVIHSTNNVNRFLSYPGGKPSQNILEMVIPEIRQLLRRLLFQAEKNTKEEVSKKKNSQLNIEGSAGPVKLVVHKISNPGFPDGLMHVIFIEDDSEDLVSIDTKNIKTLTESDSDIIENLENELEYTKEMLHNSVEEYETSNEELRASNEELQSMNEELQSTAEQLETSQEELQSVNEELKSVNLELEKKIDSLHQANNNLKNLMEATNIATIFVDLDKNIQFFTSRSSHLFNLIKSDKGRPFSHITHQLQYEGLMDDIDQVLNNSKQLHKIVKDESGATYIMRVNTFQTIKEETDGVVVTFVDITALKEAEEKLAIRIRQQKGLSELAIDVLKEPELDNIFELVVQKLIDILNVDYCTLFNFIEEKKTLKLLETNIEGLKEKQADISTTKKWDVSHALTISKPLITSDYQKEKNYQLSPSLKDLGITSGLVATIGNAKKTFGVLGLYTKQAKEYTQEEVQFIQLVANITGLSFERKEAYDAKNLTNNRLTKEVSRSKKFQREILSTNISDRWALGAYLHDNLAQSLAAIKLTINDLQDGLTNEDQKAYAAQLDLIEHQILSQIDNIRNLSHQIIPIDVEKEGVTNAFVLLVRQTQKNYDVKCTLDIDDSLDKICDVKLSTNIYHIVQEALLNAINHGEAKNVKLIINTEKDQLNIQVLDDGVGFSSKKSAKNGVGLRIMKHRVELLDGKFTTKTLKNDPKFNTSVGCRIPLNSKK